MRLALITMRKAVCLLMLLALAPLAQAADVTGTLTTAWEAFWQQTGFPRAAYRWQEPLRVRLTGDAVARHREFTLKQLRTTAEWVGLTVTEAASDDITANIHVEFFSPNAPLPQNQPCVTNIRWRNSVIMNATIKANSESVWRCMLHEAMHLMGVPGHPLYNSILTYFARGSELTSVDKLLLSAMYSKEIVSGATPFEVLQALAVRAADGDSAAREQADVFLRKTIREMEAFGEGRGEAPPVIVRSGKATPQGLQRGRVEIQYFLGIAYWRGHIVSADKDKAHVWLSKAAASSHDGAAALLKRMAEPGP